VTAKRSLLLQRQIIAAIQERGHLELFTPEQFLARQAVKLLEKSCELFLVYPWRAAQLRHLRDLATAVRETCRAVFDDKTLWQSDPFYPISGAEIDNLLYELADVGIVAAFIAETAGTIRGEKYNLIRLAWDKAMDDIKREDNGNV